jgi:hypothetical protein
MSTDRTVRSVVTALVGAGLVEPARAGEAERVVGVALAPEAAGTSLRRRMSEIAGYVGGAFVVGAAVLFFATEWHSLGQGARGGLLAGAALLLAGAAGALVATGGGPRSVRRPEQQVRRRLASVLATGSAATAAFAVGVLAQDPASYTDDSRAVLLGAGTALVVATLGYLLAPGVVGQVGMAVAAFVMVPSGLDAFASVTGLAMGGLVLALGVGWLALVERGVLTEDTSGRVIGSVLVLVGAQMPVLEPESPEWVGYLVTAVVAAAAFGMYVLRLAWPYLALGVVAVTVVVPEALFHWTRGSLGSAGVLLVAGLTLLVAALLGLRLRHEVSGGPRV